MLKRVTRMLFSQYVPSIKFLGPHHLESNLQSSLYSGKKIKLSNREALNQAIDEQIKRDQNVFVIGEEVGHFHGAYQITKGLIEKYGERKIVDTPGTEAGFAGMAVGAALMGLKPIVQFMAMSHSLKCIDHIINSSAKLHYMSGGELAGGSIVFRGFNGPVQSFGAQHTQCFVSYYASVPGLITLSPYDAEDCKGLLKAAVRNPNPVVFLENKTLYEEIFQVPEEVQKDDFLIPIGKSKIMRQGKDVTIVAYSINVKYSLQAAKALEKQGIDCQVINLRSIKPLDRDTIIKSVIKTGRMVTVEDGYPQHGIGAELAAIIHETKAFDYIKGPVQRVTAIDIPLPYSTVLEVQVIPKTNTIITAVKKVMKFK